MKKKKKLIFKILTIFTFVFVFLTIPCINISATAESPKYQITSLRPNLLIQDSITWEDDLIFYFLPSNIPNSIECNGKYYSNLILEVTPNDEDMAEFDILGVTGPDNPDTLVYGFIWFDSVYPSLEIDTYANIPFPAHSINIYSTEFLYDPLFVTDNTLKYDFLYYSYDLFNISVPYNNGVKIDKSIIPVYTAFTGGEYDFDISTFSYIPYGEDFTFNAMAFINTKSTFGPVNSIALRTTGNTDLIYVAQSGKLLYDSVELYFSSNLDIMLHHILRQIGALNYQPQVKADIGDLIFSTANAPIRVMLDLLDISIFGVPLYAIFGSLLTIILAVWAIKKFV